MLVKLIESKAPLFHSKHECTAWDHALGQGWFSRVLTVLAALGPKPKHKESKQPATNTLALLATNSHVKRASNFKHGGPQAQ